MAQSTVSTRLKYFLRSGINRLRSDRTCCPSCGKVKSKFVHRKALVTELRRCSGCELLFRIPTDPPDFDEGFYQTEYRSGFTTDCPTEEALKPLIESEFKGSEKDFTSRLGLFEALGITPDTHSILDFGCSWGYGTWQFANRGFNTTGLEISEPRARYGREKLSINVVESMDQLGDQKFDVFFSSHVAEHFASPQEVVQFASKLLKPGGVFIAYTPNGCEEFMHENPLSYHRSWGGVHPSYLDDRFWFRQFPDARKLIGATPLDLEAIRTWDRSDDLKLSLIESELVFVAVT